MPGTVQSVERAAAMLQVLAAEAEPMGLSQVAGAIGLAKGTAHGLIRTLVEVGFVEQHPETGLYSVGVGLLQLGATSLDVNELRSRALNWTDALASRTAESAQVGVFTDGEMLIAHHVFRPDNSAQALRTGATTSLHASALGKVMLAYDPRAARSKAAHDLESLTFRTITDRSQMLRDLADIRDRGWAAAVEEAERGVAGIAAPIRDKSGFVVAAVGIEGSLDAICDESLRPRDGLAAHVVKAARQISRELGHGRAQ